MLKGILALVFGMVVSRTKLGLGEMEDGKLRTENYRLKISQLTPRLPAFHPNPPDETGLDITLCHTCQLFPSSLESRGLILRCQGLGSTKEASRSALGSGKWSRSRKCRSVGKVGTAGKKQQMGSANAMSRRIASTALCPRPRSTVPLETRRRLETCRNFALGTSPLYILSSCICIVEQTPSPTSNLLLPRMAE